MEINLHPNLSRLSHSSLLTLHSCPRRFQLNRLLPNIPREENPTLQMGTSFGIAIQSYYEGKDINQIVWDIFLSWKLALEAEEKNINKSIWYTISAIQSFLASPETTFIREEYELAKFGPSEKPAIELHFKVDLENGFTYHGYVDLVLKHKMTGEYIVIEIKTGSRVDEARYKNSFQGLGYSIVLDKIVGTEYSSYKVIYLVYDTATFQYHVFQCHKQLSARADWLVALLNETRIIQIYAEDPRFPMHGESCYSFNRQCNHYGICNLSTESLLDINDIPISPEQPYDVEVTLMQLIDTQLESAGELL